MDVETIYKNLSNDCQAYFNLLKNCRKGNFLVRGFYYHIQDIKEFQHNLENRKPKNMPLDIHKKINSYFEPIFGWKIRNGIFCYGFDMLSGKPKDLGYGIFYLFFPIGEFNFIYSPDHFDLFGYINSAKLTIEEIISNLQFENNLFCGVMNFRKQYDNFGNEVSVKASSYYLVNSNYSEFLSNKIWG